MASGPLRSRYTNLRGLCYTISALKVISPVTKCTLLPDSIHWSRTSSGRLKLFACIGDFQKSGLANVRFGFCILSCLGRSLLLPTSGQDPDAFGHKHWDQRQNAATAESFEKGGGSTQSTQARDPTLGPTSAPGLGMTVLHPKMYNTVVPEQHCARQCCTRARCATTVLTALCMTVLY